MQLQEYAYELLKLNKTRLQPYTNDKWYSSLAFGLVEELLEYHEAKYAYESGSADLSQVTKEAGDVLAYVVLLLAAHREHLFLLNLSFHIADDYNQFHSTQFDDVLVAAATNAGLFKRWFREGQEYTCASAVFAMETIVEDLRPHSITLADIAQTNIDKLRDRANRNQLFQGTGSNR